VAGFLTACRLGVAVLAVLASGEQERDGGEHGHAAEHPRDDIVGAQARGVGAERTRDMAQRSEPSLSAQRTRRGFRVRHALRAA
jgi:hypothetical protein